uniref:Uncharacterized protein n=1 Tax=Heterosigma akashiwo TaxID=2829 RepID=A0A6S9F8I0_HETAK|mmetsp:Transcript_29396/g.46214  ORF Transcript_29396/g.46214 Transcript_29396/m.46214 type:complete len:397 (+) Transcript_29396:107-1297(+)
MYTEEVLKAALLSGVAIVITAAIYSKKKKKAVSPPSSSVLFRDVLERNTRNLIDDTENAEERAKAIADAQELESRTKHGVLRCDYEFNPTRGDIGNPDSFTSGARPVIIKVEGWTFEAAQRGLGPKSQYPASEFRLKDKDGNPDPYWTKLWEAIPQRSGYRQVTSKSSGRMHDQGYFAPEDYSKGVVMRYDPAAVEEKMRTAVKKLTDAGVCGITADVGYSQQFQQSVSDMTSVPVMLSSLQQLSLIAHMYNFRTQSNKVLVLTANSSTFDPKAMIPGEMPSEAVEIMGLQDLLFGKWVAGGNSFTRLAKDAYDAGASVQAAVEELSTAVQARKAQLEGEGGGGGRVVALVLECTELPQYANALRRRAGVPVYDAMTAVGCLRAAAGFAQYSAYRM